MIGLYGQIVYALWWRALPQPGTPPANNMSYSFSRQASVALHVRNPTCLNVISKNHHNGYSVSPNLSNRSPSAMGRTSPSYNQNLVDHQIRSRRRVAMMLIVTVALFAFCYLPVHTFNILRSTVGLPNTPVWITMSLVVHWICYMQNASNPIIYYVMSEKFRREFNRIFKCCVRPVGRLRRNSSEVFRCGRPPGQTYYHTLGFPPNRAEYSSSVRLDHAMPPPNPVVQL
ncbi:hypothetical protein RvY_12925-1 [Ramazzottius varieornatus]|uniref:G-protein coupled receptors family 1 profile domain-containing protein n=1 Tax=Ramazzottius varieornatus TaxID=947166 RepID=A0A1D1VL49_RAMVA|nr:hypothetical protein RvY_12925-1 [Ramazzottius varieornatus]